MRRGIFIPAGVVRVIVLVALVAIGLGGWREYPGTIRYLKTRKM